MSKEHQSLSERRLSLLESIATAADEIKRIDQQLSFFTEQGARPMTKGKARRRAMRKGFMRRWQVRQYDRQQYDKPTSGDEHGQEV